MLNLTGPTVQHCDGLSRRHFLTIGSLGVAGLTLPELLRAEDTAGIKSSRKSIIFLHLDGGPPQLDLWDPKPLAPREIRGEFFPIRTAIPGFHIGELMPKTAVMAKELVFIRSLVGSVGRHDAFQCQSGYSPKDLASIGGRPAMGCVLNKLRGSTTQAAPTFVDLMQGRPLVRNSARPGFLGPSFAPFRPDISKMFQRELEAGMKKELANQGADHTTSLTLDESLTLKRLHSRTELLAGLDRIRRRVDATGMMSAMDRFTQQAVGILTSGRLADALDLGKEDPKVVARYTPRIDKDAYRFTTAEGPESIRKFLLARRLIEAGVRCVSISISDFDTHSKNFPRMRTLLPMVDHGLHALVGDLRERGLWNDVTLVAWGEFGRTPVVNKAGGRDHWPRVGPALLTGGPLRGGHVLGTTDRTASAVTSRPVTYKDVFATLYHTLGINPLQTTIRDPRGRPQYLLDGGEVLREVV
jgi:Protein of unknown function (DUF1501)